MILEYSKSIPRKIPEVIRETMNLRVKSVKRLKGGEANYSFRVDTNDGLIIVRVFRYDSWPVEKNLRFVEKQLEVLGIRQSKIIHFDDSDNFFQNGFMIGEWLEGIPGREVIKKGLVTVGQMLTGVAKILKKVHTIEFDRFGEPPFSQENQGFKDFLTFVLNFGGENRLVRLGEEGLVPIELVKIGKRRLKSLLGRIDFAVKPVLVHGDVTPHNVIWTKQGPVLIDWEDVGANSWVYEWAYMTYHWGDKVKKPFLRGYGVCPNSPSEMKLLENIFHLRLALKLLPYYAYDIQDKVRLKGGVEELEKIINRLN